MERAFYSHSRGAGGGGRRHDEPSIETMDSSLTSMLTGDAPLMASMIMANSDESLDTEEVNNISPVVSFAEEELEEPGRILPHSGRRGGTRGNANSRNSTNNQSRSHYSASGTYEEATTGEATDNDDNDDKADGAPAGLLDYVLRPCPSSPKQLEDSLDHQFERVDQALEASGSWMDCMRNDNNGEPRALPEPEAPEDELIMLQQQRHPVEKKSMIMETIDSPWLDHIPCSPTPSDSSDDYDEPLSSRRPTFIDRRKHNDQDEVENDEGLKDEDDFGIKPTNSWLEYMGISSGRPSEEDLSDEAEKRRNANRDDGIDTLLQPSLSWIQIEDCKCAPEPKDATVAAAPATMHNRAIGNEIYQVMRSVGIPVPSLLDGATKHEPIVKVPSWTLDDSSNGSSNNNSSEESTLLTGPLEAKYMQETGGEDTSTLNTLQTGPFPDKDMEEAGGEDTSTLNTLQTGPFETKDMETSYGGNGSLLEHHQASNRIGAANADNAQQIDPTNNTDTNTTETAIKTKVIKSTEHQLNANGDENEHKDEDNVKEEEGMIHEQQWKQDKKQQQNLADTQSSANIQGQIDADSNSNSNNNGNCFENCGGLGGMLSTLVLAELSAQEQPVGMDNENESGSYFNVIAIDDDTDSRSTLQPGTNDPPLLDPAPTPPSQKRVTFQIESSNSEDSNLKSSSDGDVPQDKEVSGNPGHGQVQDDELSSPSDEGPTNGVGSQQQASDDMSSAEERNLYLSNVEITEENFENRDRQVLDWPGDVRVKDDAIDYEGRDVEWTDDYQPTESSSNSMESSLTNDPAIALPKSVERAIAPKSGICRSCNRWTVLIVSALVCMAAILTASVFTFKNQQENSKSSSQASPSFTAIEDDQRGGPGKNNTESGDGIVIMTDVPSDGPSGMPSGLPSSSPSTWPSPSPSSLPSESLSSLPSESPSMGPTEFGVKVVDFAAIGDAPYSSQQAEELKDQMKELDELAEFVIHVGDLRDASDDNDCELSEYEYAADLLLRSPVPVFVILGDNDRLDCPNRDEALEYWQQVFLSFENNWDHDFNVVRDPAMPHNFAFRHESVLFVGLNIPGGERSEYEDHDWDELLDLNFVWARAVIEDYDERMGDRVGRIVIFSHGKPESDHDPFYDAVTELFEDDLGSRHPALFINGDGHSWEYERDFRGRGSFVRIQVRGMAAEPPTMIRVISTGEEQNPRNAFQYHRGDGDYSPWN